MQDVALENHFVIEIHRLQSTRESDLVKKETILQFVRVQQNT